MMDVRYKRDLNSNYMIMTDAEKREEIYEDRMITENRIYGFLPCVEQKKENFFQKLRIVIREGIELGVTKEECVGRTAALYEEVSHD